MKHENNLVARGPLSNLFPQSRENVGLDEADTSSENPTMATAHKAEDGEFYINQMVFLPYVSTGSWMVRWKCDGTIFRKDLQVLSSCRVSRPVDIGAEILILGRAAGEL